MVSFDRGCIAGLSLPPSLLSMDSSALEAILERSNGIQQYVEDLGCFRKDFHASLSSNVDAKMRQMKQLSGACTGLVEQLKGLRENTDLFAQLEQCCKDAGVAIPSNKPNPKPEAPTDVTKEKAKPVPQKADVVEVAEEGQENDENDQIRFTLSGPEFESIPKYMRGRMAVKDVNDILIKMNEMLLFKRDLLMRPFKKLNQKEKDLVSLWREKQNVTPGTAVYLTEAELKPKLNDKSRLHLRVVLPCLRHVKRIREARNKGIAELYPLWM